jgi:DNA-binding transcriptional MerR regulator
MCQLLGVTKRTLARYRQQKLISHYMINGKVYYKVAEVHDFLRKKGKDAPEPKISPKNNDRF